MGLKFVNLGLILGFLSVLGLSLLRGVLVAYAGWLRFLVAPRLVRMALRRVFCCRYLRGLNLITKINLSESNLTFYRQIWLGYKP